MSGHPPKCICRRFWVGGVYTLNYDVRFSSLEKSGPGMRLGVDYFEDIFIVPVHFNYLIAKKGKFLEVGAGGTMQTGVIDFAYGTNDLKVVPTFWLGYRFQES